MRICFTLVFAIILGCQRNNNVNLDYQAGFKLISSEKTGIDFTNRVTSTNAFNFLNYSYIYNGGGVAVGDINNDGLEDIYFTSNQNSNKLYLNKGGFKFKDVTKKAGIEDIEGWSTGVTMIDINNDSYLDIYVCKSGKYNNPNQRANKLFLNNGNGTFTDVAKKWGLADTGFSTQAYFFDYDKDGDLDMYLVNHRPDFGNLRSTKIIIQEASDQLYRNDGNYFTNVSKLTNIQNKAWGLSAAIGDFNNDTWPDVYVCNDFNEPDFLYINDTKGGFKDEILTYMDHIALNSMGSDISDFDNDGLLDLIVLDMSAEDHVRSKTNMAAMNTEAFEEAVSKGNHYQYMYNMLHWNRNNATYSEIAQMAGVAKTDWSWAPLFADFDNDGMKDIIVTNGIKKDIGNVDFRNSLQQKIQQKAKMNLGSVLDMVPSERLPNYVFKNNGDLTFSKQSWGLEKPTFSNGAAYADFDNDGDLDLVINNLEDKAFVYENSSNQNYLQIQVQGDSSNVFGIGTRIELHTQNKKQYQELYVTRGYQSSVTSLQHFGLGTLETVDKIIVTWPNGKTTELKNIKSNQRITVSYNNSKKSLSKAQSKNSEPFLKTIQPKDIGIDYKHEEIPFNDYDKQLLLPYKLSQNGPYMAVADVNNDGLDDFFVGGAAGQSGKLYIQNNAGLFSISKQASFENDAKQEDLEALFFDFDNDNDHDLYVVSGSNEFNAGSQMYQDRLYENKGNGKFVDKTTSILPLNTISGQSVATADIDKDGDLDLFLGGRHVPGKYPTTPKSRLLLNEKGVFKDVTNDRFFEKSDLGMITDAVFSDYDNDGDEDLFVIGEWMPITLYENEKGYFKETTLEALQNTRGLWFSIASQDIDNDGDLDFFVGNIGLNTKFRADNNHSFQIYGNDFDKSGSFDVVLVSNYKNNLVPVRGRHCSSEQIPFIAEKFSSYSDFANASIQDIYGADQLQNAIHHEADMLESVFLENLGNREFSVKKLPNEAQLSPITDFDFFDLNNDGKKEILTLGNFYPVEVETPRFDASKGAVFQYHKNGEFTSLKNTGFLTHGDTRVLQILHTNDKGTYFIISRNDTTLQIMNN